MRTEASACLLFLFAAAAHGHGAAPGQIYLVFYEWPHWQAACQWRLPTQTHSIAAAPAAGVLALSTARKGSLRFLSVAGWARDSES